MSRLLDLPSGLGYDSSDTFYRESRFGDFRNYTSKEESQHLLHKRSAQPRLGDQNWQHSDREEQQFNNSFYDNRNAKSLLPLPDWPAALNTWGLAWDFHVYGFFCLYSVVSVVSVAIFARFRLRVQRLKIVYNTLILLATAGVFRAMFMLIDPYGYKGRMAGLMVGIMTQAVYPLFCACYGLTQVMLLRITNVDVGHSRLRTLSCLLGCTLTYLFLVVVIETLVFYQRELKLLLLLDSGCFIAWSLSLGITFICSGFRLTQYTTETKRARKELNAYSSYRRSASNNTGISALSSTTNDSSMAVFNVNIRPSEMPEDQKTSAASEEFSVDNTGSCSSPLSPTSGPLLPSSFHKANAHVRLSRPRLKISNNDHMMVTIATDDDDQSTSTTDVDKPRFQEPPKRVRRLRRRGKQRRGEEKFRSRSRTPTSSTVSTTTNNCPSKTSRSVRSRAEHKNRRAMMRDAVSNEYSSIPPVDIAESKNKTRRKICTPAASMTYSSETQDCTSSTSHSVSLEPALSSRFKHDKEESKVKDGYTSVSEECEEEDEDENTEIPHSSVDHKNSFVYGLNQPPATPWNRSVDQSLDTKEEEEFREVLLNGHDYNYENSMESTLAFAPVDMDLMSSSPRENGYLADTENRFPCSALSIFSSACQRKSQSRVKAEIGSSEVSPQRSSSSRSDDCTAASPALSDKIRSSMSASLGLFRIRQSKVVQRAVHLTYFLTFLFMFACLLQLYTVFGVYGVLATIPRPEPWPWLVFHTIFRATEVSIGMTIAVIAYIALNHRHQRAKRRHQQLQHLEATRDCIV